MQSPTLILFLFLLGLCVGSFVNVQVLRFGFKERSRSRSHCMACEAQLAWYELIPIVSFVALRGRCRSCGSKLTLQYPLVEGVTALLFVLSSVFFPPALSLASLIAFFALLVFLATLVGLVAYDFRHTLVPLPFIFTLVLAALVASVSQAFFVHSTFPLLDSFLGGFVLFSFFAIIIAITRGRGMGMGDAYVAAAAGLLLGLLRGIEAIMLGVWSATAVYLFVFLLSSLFKKTRLLPSFLRVTIRTELPFVPFLALGICLALFTSLSPLEAGRWIVDTLWLIK